MNLQRKTMYRDIDGFGDGKGEIPAVMASFVSLFLRVETVRRSACPSPSSSSGPTIGSTPAAFPAKSPAMSCHPVGSWHAMQNPGVVNIAKDVPARWARYRYFYRNDVVLYRREGVIGWLWLLAKDAWHTVQVLRDGQGSRAERIKIIWKGFAAGVKSTRRHRTCHESNGTHLPYGRPV